MLFYHNIIYALFFFYSQSFYGIITINKDKDNNIYTFKYQNNEYNASELVVYLDTVKVDDQKWDKLSSDSLLLIFWNNFFFDYALLNFYLLELIWRSIKWGFWQKPNYF